VLVRPGADCAFSGFAREHGIDVEELADRGPVDPLLVKEMRGFIAAWRPDIVQTHSYKPTSVLYALKRLGVRCGWIGFHEGATDKGLKDRIYTKLDFLMLRAAEQIVVMNELQRANFPARLAKVHVVNNAVPRMAAAENKSGLPEVLRRRRGEGRVPLIGAIGRLSREKGVDVFIDALAILKARGIAAMGIIVGEGGLEGELKRYAVEKGVGDEAVFTGRVDAMREVYEALDLMVIPSRSEGLPSVLLEALPTGLPVVSTKVGAMIEIGRQEPRAIRLVAPERPDLLADAIAAELADIDAPEAAAARARVVAAYSIERRADHMLQVYANALGARGVA
jgi:glycosyltransferase involved in cell wall biosynthesis